jgi:phage terminase small subunit
VTRRLPIPADKPLTIRQERFVFEYLKDGNASRSALAAGYSERSPGQIGSLLLRVGNVAAAIERLRAEYRMGENLNAERVKKEIARLAFVDLGKAYNDDGSLKLPREMDADTRAAIAGIDVDELWEGKGEERTQVGVSRKLKLHNKGQALELAAKVLGMVRETPALQIGRLTIVIED